MVPDFFVQTASERSELEQNTYDLICLIFLRCHFFDAMFFCRDDYYRLETATVSGTADLKLEALKRGPTFSRFDASLLQQRSGAAQWPS